MKQLALLALSLVMAFSLAACGGDRVGPEDTGTAGGGASDGVTNGVTGAIDGDRRDAIGSDLDDMVRNGAADDEDGNLNREP